MFKQKRIFIYSKDENIDAVVDYLKANRKHFLTDICPYGYIIARLCSHYGKYADIAEYYGFAFIVYCKCSKRKAEKIRKVGQMLGEL